MRFFYSLNTGVEWRGQAFGSSTTFSGVYALS
jgi:hypothetical protein